MNGLPPIKSGVYGRPLQLPADLGGRDTGLPNVSSGMASVSPNPILPNAITPSQAAGNVVGSGENAFELLLSHTNEDQKASEQAVQDLVTGKSEDVQDVVMQVVKAEMSFQIFMEVRNKLIESYNELSRMQF